MDKHYPTLDEPATPEYVLAVIRDAHRQEVAAGDAAPLKLTFQTTVADWYDALILDSVDQLGRMLNQYFDIRCSHEAWDAVLRPASTRTLDDVCRLIACHARRRRVRPATILGRVCAPAGAFLTIRSLLGAAGAQVDEIAPSTRLDSYACRYTEVFLEPISQLAPGTLPPAKIAMPLTYGYLALLAVCAAGAVVCYCSGLGPLAMVCLVVALLSQLLMFVSAPFLRPTSVEFGELKTFRDLSLLLSSQQ